MEADETFIGGAEKNKHANKKTEGTQGRSYKTKTPVFGMIERKGKLVAKKVETTSAADLTPEMVKHIKTGATLYTDEWVGYNNIGVLYNHLFVKHNEKEFVKNDIYTKPCASKYFPYDFI